MKNTCLLYSDEISESGMSILTCPASIGPIQIVTNERIAKVLLSSESFEGKHEILTMK
jgi:hypothetical protein